MTEGLTLIPPQAMDMERAVLGAMLMNAEAIDTAREILTPDDFYDQGICTCFIIICDMHDHAAPVTELSLTHELKRTSKLEAVGGILFINEIASSVGTAANVAYDAQVVQQTAVLRAAIAEAHTLSRAAYEQSDDAQALVGRAIERLSDLHHQGLKGGLVEMAKVSADLMAAIEEAHKHRGQVTGIDTGFPKLNEKTGGWQRGDLVILAARPSVGKTALALQTGKAAAEAGSHVAVFSLEMSRVQLGYRLAAQETGIDLHRMRTGDIQDDEWQALTAAVAKQSKYPMAIDDRPGLTISQIRTQCRRAQTMHKLDLVIVDYIQLMSVDVRTQSDEQAIAIISRGLKGIAREFDVPLIALSQLNRSLENRTDRRPRLSDLRSSGSLEQDADIVLFLYRPELYDIATVDVDGVQTPTANIVELGTAKNRNGPTGRFWMTWNPQATLFGELAQAWRYQDRDDDDFPDYPDNR